MSLSQIELVWVTVRMEWECFWVNLREGKKVFKSKMAVFKLKMAELKMAAIIKLSQNEWVKFFFVQMAKSKMAEFKMAAIINLSQNEWVKYFFVQNGWIEDGRFQDSCNHQVEVRMTKWSFFVQMLGTNLGICKWVWEKELGRLNPRWQNSIWLPSSS